MAAVAATTVYQTQIQGNMSEAALDGDVDQLLYFLLILSGIASIRVLSDALGALFIGRFGARADYSIRKNFINYFLRVPFSSFEKAGSGESLSIFSNDIPNASALVGGWGGFFFIAGDSLFLIASLIFMFVLNPILTLILFATIPVLVVLQVLCSLPIQKKQKIMSEESANFNAVVNDSLQNVSTIAAYSLEGVLEERYLTAYDKFFKAIRSFAVAMLPLVSVGMVAAGIPISVINVIAGIQVINERMSIADFIAYTTLVLITMSWMMMLSQTLSRLQIFVTGAKRVIENTSEKVEDLTITNSSNNSKPSLIEFKNVDFAFSDDLPLTLEKVSFSIKSGSRVAFVGESGSGKSTVLKMLLGIYDSIDGEILIDGVTTSNMSKGDLRNIFAYLPQDSFLFPESIGKNITLEDTISDQKRLDKACEDSGILDFIKSLPEKFDSILTESADNVSGGQRQRIAMARTFYKDAPIILFDEATSALDPKTEASILQSLNSAAKGKTIIMVAHRTQAISACDTIIVMDSGKVSGIGSHEELVKTNDIYKRLYEVQCEKEKTAGGAK